MCCITYVVVPGTDAVNTVVLVHQVNSLTKITAKETNHMEHDVRNQNCSAMSDTQSMLGY